MQQSVKAFCWVISTQYFAEFGYGKIYMRFTCEAQAYVEFDKVWPCQNQENKSLHGCANDTNETEGEEGEQEVQMSSLFSKFPLSPFEEANRHKNRWGSYTDGFWGSDSAKKMYFSHKLNFDPEIQRKLDQRPDLN